MGITKEITPCYLLCYGYVKELFFGVFRVWIRKKIRRICEILLRIWVLKNVPSEYLIKWLSSKFLLFWWVVLGTPRKNWLLYWPRFSILSILQVEACYGGTLIWRLLLCLWECIATLLLYIMGTYAYNFIYIIDYWLWKKTHA